MSNFDEPTAHPRADLPRVEASQWVSDDDLVAFALPTRASARDIDALVRRYPVTALIVAVGLGIVIGKLLR